MPGVATGLAVTGAGGDVLFIEATTMEGEPGLTLTGQLGDVMKESAQIALSYLRSNGERLGYRPEALAGRRIHVHFPAGAVPKDGPRAGITMVTALASLVTGRPVRPEVGMTGEVTLTGRVLPIGGVKQKLLAAHRAGLTEVIIPARNEPDLDDVPAEVREAADRAPRGRRGRRARAGAGAGERGGRGARRGLTGRRGRISRRARAPRRRPRGRTPRTAGPPGTGRPRRPWRRPRGRRCGTARGRCANAAATPGRSASRSGSR